MGQPDDDDEPQLSATSPATATATDVFSDNEKTYAFLPDFTEHPKPKRRYSTKGPPVEPPPVEADDDEEDEVTFMHDFVAGGCAGCASVIVGHPFDTIKVRMQTSKSSTGLFSTLAEFGGPMSLFRGMAAPLASAAVINAIVFSSYGAGSRFYDEYLVEPPVESEQSHDPWQKSWCCGSFAGLVQCTVICPMEHVKCRLQVQHGKGSADTIFKGPVQATRNIINNHGLRRFYTGWWSTVWREVPAFGLYFASYDYLKDRANTILSEWDHVEDNPTFPQHTHTWIASAFAGGCAGSLTWAIVYPIDVIKTRVQTAPLDTPRAQLSMYSVGRSIVAQNGWRSLFRGLSVTLIRAFPVNGTIFPVYEFALKQLSSFGNK